MAFTALQVVIRADASLEIGIGHVMRCLTLADELVRRGAAVRFLCRREEGNLMDAIRAQGYAVLELPPDISDEVRDALFSADLLAGGPAIDWLVVDHYALGERWERIAGGAARRIMVIDDLADRAHICDLLLDQNYHDREEGRYAHLVPASCRRLLGPAYALLRPEFRRAREGLRVRDGSVRRIMVFFGGSDLTNETGKVLHAMAEVPAFEGAIDVIIGVNNPHQAAIESAAQILPHASCYRNVTDMASLMEAADLYIGAAGSTTWERCCLGLPSLVVTVAENQERPIEELERVGVLKWIGRSETVTAGDVAAVLRSAVADSAILLRYSDRSRVLVDGLGVERCADAMGITLNGQ